MRASKSSAAAAALPSVSEDVQAAQTDLAAPVAPVAPAAPAAPVAPADLAALAALADPAAPRKDEPIYATVVKKKHRVSATNEYAVIQTTSGITSSAASPASGGDGAAPSVSSSIPSLMVQVTRVELGLVLSR